MVLSPTDSETSGMPSNGDGNILLCAYACARVRVCVFEQKIMNRLVKRYIINAQSDRDHDEVNEGRRSQLSLSSSDLWAIVIGSKHV